MDETDLHGYAELAFESGARVRLYVTETRIRERFPYYADSFRSVAPRMSSPEREYVINGFGEHWLPVRERTGPLAKVLDAIAQDGKPALALVVEHSPDGSLQSAWDRCDDPDVMIQALAAVGHEGLSAAREAVRDAVNKGLDRCPAIRRVVPHPPTLAELITAARGS